MSGINMETIKTLEMINMLVQKAKNGVKPFSEATLENMDNYIFYDEKKPKLKMDSRLYMA